MQRLYIDIAKSYKKPLTVFHSRDSLPYVLKSEIFLCYLPVAKTKKFNYVDWLIATNKIEPILSESCISFICGAQRLLTKTLDSIKILDKIHAFLEYNIDLDLLCDSDIATAEAITLSLQPHIQTYWFPRIS